MLTPASALKVHSDKATLGQLLRRKHTALDQLGTVLEQTFDSTLIGQGLQPDLFRTLKPGLTQLCQTHEKELPPDKWLGLFRSTRAKQAGTEVNQSLTQQFVQQLQAKTPVQIEQLQVSGKTLAYIAKALKLNVFERLNYDTTHEYIAAKMTRLH